MKITSVVVIYANESVEGTTYYLSVDQSNTDTETTGHLILDEVYMSYAGLVAERMHYKDICGSSRFPWVLKEGSSPDLKNASAIIKKFNLALPGKPRQELKRKVQQELTRLMTDHWDDLKLMAHALYKTKRLSYEDLKSLLTKKSKHRDFWKGQFREIGSLFDAPESLDSASIRAILIDV